MRRTYLGLLLALGTLAPLTAQTVFYAFSGGVAGPGGQARSDPFGQPSLTSHLGQYLVSRLRFQNAPVTITSLSLSPVWDGVITLQHLVVRMGHWAPDSFTNTNFAQNRPAVLTTVLDVQQYTWPARSGEWVDIGLASPFVYTPTAGNLFLEVEALGASGSLLYFNMGFNSSGGSTLTIGNTAFFNGATAPQSGQPANWAPVMRLGVDLATVAWLGQGCAGSSGTNPGLGIQGTGQLGTTTSIVLSNALPAQLSFLVFGFSIAPPLPQSLTAIGMPNCFQYCDVVATAALMTSATGVASYSLPIPRSLSE